MRTCIWPSRCKRTDLLPRTDARRSVAQAVAKDEPIQIDAIDSPYSSIPSLKATIYAPRTEPTPEPGSLGQRAESSGHDQWIPSSMKTISIVTPCYNEEVNVRELYERVRAADRLLGRLPLRAHLH